MAMMPIVGFLLGHKVDARYIIPVGLLCLAGASYWQAHMNQYTWPLMFISPRCVQMAGVGMLFVPLNNAAYLYLARNQARVMAYVDAFWIFAIMALAALPLVLVMKKSVAQGEIATH